MTIQTPEPASELLVKSMPDINSLLRLAKSPPEIPATTLRVGLLADTATQVLARALRGMIHFRGAGLDLFEGEYDQIDLQVLNPTSELYDAKPETVILYPSIEKVTEKFAGTSQEDRHNFAQRFLARISDLHQALSAKGCMTICLNLAEPADGIFGHFSNKISASLTYQVRQINFELMRMAEAHQDFHIFDLASLQAEIGRSALSDPKIYTSARMALTPEACRLISRDLASMMLVGKGGGVIRALRSSPNARINSTCAPCAIRKSRSRPSQSRSNIARSQSS